MTTTNDTAALYETGIHLWHEWTRMWNEQPTLARTLVAERFVLHLVPPGLIDPSTVVTPAEVEQWVVTHVSKFDRLRFHNECGPFVDARAGVVVGPWWAEAVIAGTPKIVCGMDAIAFRDGKITEYWTVGKDAPEKGRWAQQVNGR